MYEITCLTGELAREILYSHQRRRHPRDPNNKSEEGIHDVSDRVIKKKALLNHVETHADDDLEIIPDTNSTGDSGDDTCVEIHSNEEWMRDYGGGITGRRKEI